MIQSKGLVIFDSMKPRMYKEGFEVFQLITESLHINAGIGFWAEECERRVALDAYKQLHPHDCGVFVPLHMLSAMHDTSLQTRVLRVSSQIRQWNLGVLANGGSHELGERGHFNKKLRYAEQSGSSKFVTSVNFDSSYTRAPRLPILREGLLKSSKWPEC